MKVYEETSPTIPRYLEAIELSLQQDSSQKERLEKLKPLVRGKTGELGQTISLYKAGKVDEALAVIRSELGLRYMDEIRALISQIKAENTDHRLAQYAQTRQTERWLLVTKITSAALIIALAILSVLMVSRANFAMQEAQSVLQNANAELEANVAARTAELTAANEEIQRFAYIVSHDLRSPLVNIMGFTNELDMLKTALLERLETARPEGAVLAGANGGGAAAASDSDAELIKDFDEAVGFIKASITKMDRLINAILKISRQGSRALEPERIDLNELFASIGNGVAHQAQEAEADIEIGGLPTIVSDRLALEQIFSNLIDNALKYLERDRPGHVSVNGENDGAKVIIRISDNGRGISDRDQGRIFEMFRRAGPQDRPGEGMGLAHVRALVRRVGGSIGLQSELGKGSTFIVTLPRTLPHQSRRINA
ncbi:MAG: histidine kinase [Rhodomicrobium sp.]|nr:histidine kinase [Rhodomicrobium sp.]